ncbi:Inner membrane protein yphA [Bordetella ansorpii]|uniref:Inner membrane protein yphA n=1 Tax=Bordetella ansorpii TaxID=288768 RepID=A0A157NG29_9BORD|nr:DoxX family protein [Bordetella ansorpii]SAI19984.1 Inner membrane protein yphA [Bordetella ansorpii]
MSASQRFLPLAGRLLIGVPFLITGFSKLGNYSGTVGYIASAGLPLPAVGWAVAVLIEVVFAALLILGWRVRPVALVMALFTLATAVFFHNDLGNQGQFINFIKNLMITGGLLQIVAFGGGALSLDGRSGRA